YRAVLTNPAYGGPLTKELQLVHRRGHDRVRTGSVVAARAAQRRLAGANRPLIGERDRHPLPRSDLVTHPPDRERHARSAAAYARRNLDLVATDGHVDRRAVPGQRERQL